MKPVMYIRSAHLEVLRASIKGNIGRYSAEEPWIDRFFEDSQWFLESGVVLEDSLELRQPDATSLYDLENTEKLFTALRHLSPAQASDERLWVALAHKRFWSYMVRRWPAEGKKRPIEFIRERFFFMPNRSRALVRNGLARLWWYGYLSYDEQRSDPFELTRILLQKLDITQSLLERSISNVQGMTRLVLEALERSDQEGIPFTRREDFRDLMKYINEIGGVTVLDTLEKQELLGLIRVRIREIVAGRNEEAKPALVD